MRTFVQRPADAILNHFRERQDTLQMFIAREYTSEEWFRIEILTALASHEGIEIAATNRAGEARDRPDLVVTFGDQTLSIELKVLPTDRNYQYAYQRFQAGANNGNDFRRLQDGDRDGVIYIYWPTAKKWETCKDSLLRDYPGVACIRSDEIACGDGVVMITYWGHD